MLMTYIRTQFSINHNLKTFKKLIKNIKTSYFNMFNENEPINSYICM